MKAYRIYLIRNGASAANTERRFGCKESPLAPMSEKEVGTLRGGEVFRRAERVYTSPYESCKQTAGILFPKVTTLTLNGFSELDFGDFDGKKFDELKNDEYFKAYMQSSELDARPPNGESARELIARVYDAFERVVREMMREEMQKSAIVASLGVISNLISCFGLPKYAAKDIKCEYFEGFEILVTAQMWQQSGVFEVLGRVPDDYSRNKRYIQE